MADSVNYYVVESGKALFGSVYNGISWGSSKIFGTRSNDSKTESLSDGYIKLITCLIYILI